METAPITLTLDRYAVIAPGLSSSRPLMMFRPQERRDHPSRERVVRRISGEFDDMPGLRLTLPQAQRLFGLREDICVRVLNALVEQARLRKDANGTFVRNSGSP